MTTLERHRVRRVTRLVFPPRDANYRSNKRVLCTLSMGGPIATPAYLLGLPSTCSDTHIYLY